MIVLQPGPVPRFVGRGRNFTMLGWVCLLAAVAGRADDWPPAPPLQVLPEIEAGPLPPSVSAESVRPSCWRCTFRFRPPDRAQTVTLAGTFNGWNPRAAALSGPDAEGRWTASVELGPGVHYYKFVVDSREWLIDPLNPEKENDGHGGHNSVVRLGRLAHLKSSAARPGDGQIDAIGLEHRPDRPRYFQALSHDRILVRLQTLAHDVEHTFLAVRGAQLVTMNLVDQDDRFALYEAEADLPAESKATDGVRRVEYTFVLADGILRASAPEIYTCSFSTKDIFSAPEWARHAVWYQIMLDRFRNGNRANDPDPVVPWTQEWFRPAPFEGLDGQTFYRYYVFQRFYGGDLDGLEQKLPYLKELGVNALYLNPIFKAPSYHKYDTQNHVHVDDHFGTRGDYLEVVDHEDLLNPATWRWTESDRCFLRFLEKAHAEGFRVIIDGVFNHVGTAHPAFLDVQARRQKSPFAEWFNVTSWQPLRYTGWAGLASLPEFRKSATGLASESLKQYIFNVTRRWMDPNGDGDPSDGVDGWRLDVPNEIPAPFWAEWRQLVKSINPDAYICGEIWDRADPWLDGRHFDGVMNYPFARAVVAWVFDRRWKITASEFDRRLRELRLAYPQAASFVLQNLLDSHDTDRVASMAFNPDRAYDHANRVQDSGPDYNNAKPSPEAYARARLATFIQMTYAGAPMIYYGDEVGMWGADDPTCRKPMLWKDLEPYENPEENFVMEDHLAYYRQIIGLRRAHSALRTGSFTTLLADDAADVWAFMRKDGQEQIIVAVNASEQTRRIAIQLPADAPCSWQGVFNSAECLRCEEGRLEVTVPGLAGVVLSAPAAR
jgi:cyclomaltodextrinase